jgi:hypothetical protein
LGGACEKCSIGRNGKKCHKNVVEKKGKLIEKYNSFLWVAVASQRFLTFFISKMGENWFLGRT